MSHARTIALLMIALAVSAWHFANAPAAKSQDFGAATCACADQSYSQGACAGWAALPGGRYMGG